jgi:DNA-binding MarR family transcriptional regulator
LSASAIWVRRSSWSTRSKGYVHRRPDPADGRCTFATLTDEGHQEMLGGAEHVALVRRLVFDPLTRAQVKQLMDRVRDGTATGLQK